MNRNVNEGIKYQGVDEEQEYTVTTTPWGSSPSNVTVVVKDITAGFVDVSAAVLSGSPNVVGDVITTPKVKSLTAGRAYRMEIKFTSGRNIYECYVGIIAEM